MSLRNWIPDRKVWGGGLVMVGAWGGVKLAAEAGYVLSLDDAFVIIGILALVASYLLPPAWRDRLRVVDEALINAASQHPGAVPPALASVLADAEVGRAVLAGSDLPQPSPGALPPQTGTPSVAPRR